MLKYRFRGNAILKSLSWISYFILLNIICFTFYSTYTYYYNVNVYLEEVGCKTFSEEEYTLIGRYKYRNGYCSLEGDSVFECLIRSDDDYSGTCYKCPGLDGYHTSCYNGQHNILGYAIVHNGILLVFYVFIISLKYIYKYRLQVLPIHQ
jgi:hypothetical protein